jgi:cytoskeletal protein CcmA (bactofilin family)
MKKAKFLAALFVSLVTLGVLFTVSANAQSFRTGDSVTTSSNETIDSTLFVAGSTLTIESNVNGDLFCAGQTVVVSGDIEGDIICAAQTMTISGNVSGDVRLASQTITLSGEIQGNATIFTSTLVQDSNGVIGGDLNGASSDTTLSGEVARDVAIASSSLTINGSIGRNIIGNVQDLVLNPGSIVYGNIDYTSENEITQNEGSEVLGTISITTPEQASGSGSIFGISIALIIYILISAIIVSLTLVLIAPRFFNSVTENAIKSPWKTLLVGFLVTFLAPILGFVLLITFFGIPLALTLGVGWLFVALLSGPFSAYLVGRWLLPNSIKPVRIILLGSVVLLMAYLVPILGFFALLFAYWMGVGMLSIEFANRYPKPVYSFSRSETKKVEKSSKAKPKTKK